MRQFDFIPNPLLRPLANYTVNHKKVHPFDFYNKFIKCSPNVIIFGRKYSFINIVYGGVQIACPTYIL